MGAGLAAMAALAAGEKKSEKTLGINLAIIYINNKVLMFFFYLL
jgi:hypothetical protein